MDRRGRTLSARTIEAHHESGHTISAYELGMKVMSATIVDIQGDGLGGAVVVEHPTWLIRFLRHRVPLRVQRDKRRRMLIDRHLLQAVAGYEAESILIRGGRPPHNFWPGGKRTDAGDAVILARLLGVRGTRKIKRFVESYRPKARAVLKRRWRAVEAFAKVLEHRLERAVVSGTEATERLGRSTTQRASRKRASRS
jgi:hypothetical protein